MSTSIKASCGTDLLISVEDFELVSGFRWHINSRGYARTQKRVGKKMIHTKLHKLIAQAKPGEYVDHINRIKTDNRRENLRIVTPLINCLNRSPRKNKASKFKGVFKQKNKWQVYVNSKYIGIFATEEEAAMAYDNNVVKVYGEYATTNKGMGLL